jgi:hypothetical protein
VFESQPHGIGFSHTGLLEQFAAPLGLLTRLTYLLSVSPGGIWLAVSPEIKNSIQRERS